VSEIRREGRNELLVRLADARVRALANVSADRLADITPVEADLARRHLRVAELDLRYRDQVIARLP
jgi:cell division protein FtsQ